MPTAREKRRRNYSIFIRFGAAPLALAGWIATSLPSIAITTSYRNDFRSCAGRLTKLGLAADAVASACGSALNPRDLSRCVAQIEERTEIAAADALSTCRQVRRPNELAQCVVGISRENQQAAPDILNYCGRSLLPVRFAECVVGLRREINYAPTQALETCISASDGPREFLPNFLPQNQTAPVQPAPTPTAPPVEPSPPPAQPTPSQPTAPEAAPEGGK